MKGLWKMNLWKKFCVWSSWLYRRELLTNFSKHWALILKIYWHKTNMLSPWLRTRRFPWSIDLILVKFARGFDLILESVYLNFQTSSKLQLYSVENIFFSSTLDSVLFAFLDISELFHVIIKLSVLFLTAMYSPSQDTSFLVHVPLLCGVYS